MFLRKRVVFGPDLGLKPGAVTAGFRRLGDGCRHGAAPGFGLILPAGKISGASGAASSGISISNMRRLRLMLISSLSTAMTCVRNSS